MLQKIERVLLKLGYAEQSRSGAGNKAMLYLKCTGTVQKTLGLPKTLLTEPVTPETPPIMMAFIHLAGATASSSMAFCTSR
jgi:hypothetical protein